MNSELTGIVRPNTLLTRISYAFRRYWWLALIIVGITTLAAATLGSRVSSNVAIYEADALVVARTLEIRAEELPRAAAAVFRAGAVARSVASEMGNEIDPDDLIPDQLDLEPVESTIAMRVVGKDSDPQVAADLANLGGAALVRELNRVGPGFGVFSLHTEAVAPSSASNDPPPLSAIGFVAGLIMAVGLIGLIVSVQRPVLDPRQAASIAGKPLLGDIVLDSSDNVGSLANIPGLAPVANSLGIEPGKVRYLVSTQLSTPKLSLFGCALARFIASGERNVILVDPTSPKARCGSAAEQKFILRRPDLDPDSSRLPPTIVVGRYSASSRRDSTVAIDPTIGTVALVIGAGASVRQISAASAALGDRIDGVIYVHRETVSDYFRSRAVPTRA